MEYPPEPEEPKAEAEEAPDEPEDAAAEAKTSDATA
jgi:hypothetical protein